MFYFQNLQNNNDIFIFSLNSSVPNIVFVPNINKTVFSTSYEKKQTINQNKKLDNYDNKAEILRAFYV